jgi:hypothetical protein
MDLGIFILSSVVCFFPGRETMTSAWKSAIHFAPRAMRTSIFGAK